MARAELFDGTVLDFEDGTPDAVIEKVARRETERIRTDQARKPLSEGVKASTGRGLGLGQASEFNPPEPTRAQGPSSALADIRANEAARGARLGLSGQQPLPEDVAPSTAGAGRGRVNPYNATVRRADQPLADKREAVDEAVNLIESGVDRSRVYGEFEQQSQLGVRQSDIEARGIELGGPQFTAQTNAGTVREGAMEGTVQPIPAPPRSIFAYANDTMINVANASVGIGKTISDLTGPDSGASKRAEHFIKEGQRQQSQWQKNKRTELQESLADANGQFDKAGKYLYHAIVEDPLNTLSEAAGNIGPFVLVGKALTGLKAGQATAASMTVAGAATAGEVRGNIWEAISSQKDEALRKSSPEYAKLRESGMDEKQAKREVGANLLRNLPELVAAGAIGALGGKFGLEALATGVKVSTGRISAGLIGMVDEGSQGAVEQLATNIGVKRTLPGQKLLDDVLLNAVAEGVVGFPAGVLAGGNRQELAAGQARYDAARAKGFHVKPPLTTDPPDVQRKKTTAIFDALAAQVGLAKEAVTRAKEAATSMPLDKVGGFFKRYLGALQTRNLTGAPIDAHAADTLDAGPVAPPPEEGAQTIWRSKDTDTPVTVAKTAPQAGPNGRMYQAVVGPDGVPSFVPADELVEAKPAKPEIVPATATAQDDAADEIARLLGKESAPTIDATAHAAATSPTNDLPEPTPGQIEAGNYRKGHDRIGGLELSIENPEGSTRRSKPDAPVAWEREITGAHYGYIRGTVGMDGDHIDMFVKPGTPRDFDGTAFVIDQIDPATGKPDEVKVMLGYATIDEAKAAYQANYPKDWNGLKTISATPMAGLKTWLAGDTSQPFHKRAPTTPAPAAAVPLSGSETAPASAARVLAQVGITPKAATPLELRPNADGSATPWHEGREVLDFDSGKPLRIPPGTGNQAAIDLIRPSFGKSTKVFKVEKDAPGSQAEKAPAISANPPAPAPVSDVKAPADPATVPAATTQAEALVQLERGDKVVRYAGTDYESTTWIEKTRAGKVETYVVKERDRGGVTFTIGPVGADRQWGWGRHDAARRAIQGWEFAKAPNPAPTDFSSAAFANDYAAFDGLTVEQQVTVADTGQTATLRMDAAHALRTLDARLKTLRELKACIGRSA